MIGVQHSIDGGLGGLRGDGLVFAGLECDFIVCCRFFVAVVEFVTMCLLSATEFGAISIVVGGKERPGLASGEDGSGAGVEVGFVGFFRGE